MTQGFEPELLLGPSTFPCLQVLGSKLDLPVVNFIPAGPIDPVFSLLWRGTNHRAAVPNPLSYLPQVGMSVASQHLVSVGIHFDIPPFSLPASPLSTSLMVSRMTSLSLASSQR